MAVHGSSFCSSAWHAFLLNMKHAMKFSSANFLTSVFIFISKLGMVALNCYSLYMIMWLVFKDTQEVASMSGPLLVVGLFTFFCSDMFLGLFDEIIVSLLTCLCIDSDIHNHRPKYGPREFHILVDKFIDEIERDEMDSCSDEEEARKSFANRRSAKV